MLAGATGVEHNDFKSPGRRAPPASGDNHPGFSIKVISSLSVGHQRRGWRVLAEGRVPVYSSLSIAPLYAPVVKHGAIWCHNKTTAVEKANS